MRLLTLFLFSILFTTQTLAAIYGIDDRKDINEVPAFKSKAAAVAVTVANNFLVDRGDHFEMSAIGSAQDSVGLCASERFSQQPVFDIGTCTGFLIAPKLLLTAGHCILPNGVVNQDSKSPFCSSFSWYFNFNNAAKIQTTKQIISKNDLYRCTRVIRAENLTGDDNDPKHDFAILELDRPVAGVTPLPLRKNAVLKNESVFTIGHPIGLPAKYSGGSQVIDSSLANTFRVNLDTAGGNSGGPVFDQKQDVVGILISGHPVDLTEVSGKNCVAFNRCNSSGSVCTENSKFKNLPVSNFVQRLDPVFQMFKK